MRCQFNKPKEQKLIFEKCEIGTSYYENKMARQLLDQLTEYHIDELKSMENMPFLTMQVLLATMVILNKDPNSETVKKEIMDPDFLKSLQNARILDAK